MTVLLSALHGGDPRTENLVIAIEATLLAFAIFLVACLVIGAGLTLVAKLVQFLWRRWTERRVR